MTCPKCNGKATTYYTTKEVDCTYRIRECAECGHRWNTVEIDADLYASIVKGSANREIKIKKR